MRLAVLVVLAACDLQPAPKPALHRDAAEPDALPAPPLATDAELAPPDSDLAPPSADCVTTAEHIAAVLIDSADAGARGSFEGARGNMVRVMAAACTKQSWNADRQQCMRLAKLEVDVRACESKYPIIH
ncbi:MAG TPA: hypothetical protein VH143_16375 [Kofleriaceae bacterium]|jgi:hypothetical protein|nr:hypothetical protein [Kofleriaceae bacterium]